jgi:hypothetical protein
MVEGYHHHLSGDGILAVGSYREQTISIGILRNVKVS